MATTPKSLLRYPVLSDTANGPRDFGNLAADIDGRIITVCTSATRPASPGTGQMVYETDTKATNIYNGARWSRVNDTEVGNNVMAGTPTLASGSWTTLCTVNATTLGGALRITGSTVIGNANSGGDKLAQVRLTVDGTAQTPTIQDIDLRYIPSAGPTGPAAFTWPIAAPAAGSHTYLLQAQASAVSSLIAYAASLVVIEKA